MPLYNCEECNYEPPPEFNYFSSASFAVYFIGSVLLDNVGIANDDWSYLQLNSKGGLYVTGSEVENAAVQSEPLLIGGRYDASNRTLDDGDAGAVALTAAGRVIVDFEGIHVDDGDFTMMYYPKLDWKPEWLGGTAIWDDEGKNIDRVCNYVGNRLLIFPASNNHQAMPVSRFCYELRPVVVFKCYVKGANVDRLDFYKD